jgi:hypothetical protein
MTINARAKRLRRHEAICRMIGIEEDGYSRLLTCCLSKRYRQQRRKDKDSDKKKSGRLMQRFPYHSANKGKRICLSALYHHKEWLSRMATEICFFQYLYLVASDFDCKELFRSNAKKARLRILSLKRMESGS